MLEVLPHPYFMSTSERQTFSIAMGGVMIANYLDQFSGRSVMSKAITPRLTELPRVELRRLINGTLKQIAAAVQAAPTGGAGAAENQVSSAPPLQPSDGQAPSTSSLPSAAAPGAARGCGGDRGV